MVFTEDNCLHYSQINAWLLHLGNIDAQEICQYKKYTSKASIFCFKEVLYDWSFISQKK